ncbi:MAG: hypothetical protein RL404_1967 [Pseudomonadota bacterium]
MKPCSGPMGIQTTPASGPEARIVPTANSSAAPLTSQPDARVVLAAAGDIGSRIGLRVEPRVAQRAEANVENRPLTMPLSHGLSDEPGLLPGWLSSFPLPWPPQGAPRLPEASRFYPALRDAMGDNLLMQASRAGNVAMVAYLLGACPLAYAQSLDIFGRNAAMMARDGGHTEVLALLLQAGVPLQPDNPALQWYLQRRSDLAAAAVQDWQPFASLLTQGNVINLRDAQGRSLIFHAVMNADLNAVRFLCGCTTPPFLGWRDAYGLSVLRYTTRIPNVETGAAICQELRTLRRRTRWLHKRRPRREDDADTIAWSEPAWRKMRHGDT